jgi:hypothetical protein
VRLLEACLADFEAGRHVDLDRLQLRRAGQANENRAWVRRTVPRPAFRDPERPDAGPGALCHGQRSREAETNQSGELIPGHIISSHAGDEIEN